MKIIVKNLKGNQFEIDIEGSDTVKQVKEKIQEEQKIEVEAQKLVCVGKVMADDKTVEEYKLKDGDFIVVMVSKPKPKKEKKPDATPAPVPTQPVSAPSTGMNTSAPSSGSAGGHAATAPPPVPQQPAQTSEEGGSSGFLRGEELEKTLKEMQDMGFPREECMRALRAAYYNPDRAVDYLLNGIPDEPQPQPHQQPSHGGGHASHGGDGGEGGANPLAFLQNNPMFAQLRQRLINEPQFFQTFMNQLAQTQPQLHQAISANPQAFLALLLGQGGGDEGAEHDPPGTIRVTQEEKEAIERLAGLGFPKHRAIEAYFACDKNEEWAANYLFENNMADENYEEQLAQEESVAEAHGHIPGDDDDGMYDDIPDDAHPPVQNPPAQNPPAQQNPPADNDNMNVDQPAEGQNDGNKDNQNNQNNDDEDGSCL